MCGKRHPYQCKYKVGITESGILKALELHLFCNKGAALDWGGPWLHLAFNTIDNCYKTENFYVDGRVCRTNIPTNTSTRAPGWAQAIFFMEHIMEHIATHCNIPPDVVKTRNFYKPGDETPYHQPVTNYPIPRMWEEIQGNANYKNRLAAVETFNTRNRWTKRGISMVPVKFGVSWAGGWFGSLVNIYSDGSVWVSTGGIEMGQGLNTKVAQAAAMILEVPVERITVYVASTATQPNVSATQGSVGSELSAKATMQACKILRDRLEPIRRQTAEPRTWERVIERAYNAGVHLQASAFTNPNPPNCGPYHYNSHIVACTEVELDVLTGEIQIIRSDILYDCGISMNPAIDVGQIEGGFVQGLGWHLTEDIVYEPDGTLLTNGTWEYKPPSSKDIPIQLNVKLLKNSTDENCVLSAKAVGEPPLTVSCVALFAVQHAISAARQNTNNSDYFELDSPATVDRIQTKCLIDDKQFILA